MALSPSPNLSLSLGRSLSSISTSLGLTPTLTPSRRGSAPTPLTWVREQYMHSLYMRG